MNKLGMASQVMDDVTHPHDPNKIQQGLQNQKQKATWEWPEGKVLDSENRYVIINPLGRGGFGATYLAQDRILNRKVVIKAIIPSDNKAFDVTRQKGAFLREGTTLAKLEYIESPYVIKFLDLILDSRDWPCLVLEYIEGTDLSNQRLSEQKAVKYMRQITSALAEVLHPRQIYHRDIKPSNIVIRSKTDEAVLVDFGAARKVGPDEKKPTNFGTDFFKSPERLHRKQEDHRSDIYSLCVTFFVLIVGADVFHEDSVPAGVLPEAPSLDPALRAILEKGAAENPEDRYASAKELLAALDQYIAQLDAQNSLPQAIGPEVSSLLTLEQTPQQNTFERQQEHSTNVHQLPTVLEKSGFSQPSIEVLTSTNLETETARLSDRDPTNDLIQEPISHPPKRKALIRTDLFLLVLGSGALIWLILSRLVIPPPPRICTQTGFLDQRYGYCLFGPDGWNPRRLQPDPFNHEVAEFIAPTSADSPPTRLVIEIREILAKRTLQQSQQDDVNKIRKYLHNAQVLRDRSTTFAGLPAYELIYKGEADPGKQQRFYQLRLYQQNREYLLTYEASEQQYATYESEVRQAIESFQWVWQP